MCERTVVRVNVCATHSLEIALQLFLLLLMLLLLSISTLTVFWCCIFARFYWNELSAARNANKKTHGRVKQWLKWLCVRARQRAAIDDTYHWQQRMQFSFARSWTVHSKRRCRSISVLSLFLAMIFFISAFAKLLLNFQNDCIESSTKNCKQLIFKTLIRMMRTIRLL